jgi:hypothetical protein
MKTIRVAEGKGKEKVVSKVHPGPSPVQSGLMTPQGIILFGNPGLYEKDEKPPNKNIAVFGNPVARLA